MLLASQRARRQLANGAESTGPGNDKPTVVALREIAAGNITPEMLLMEPDPEPAAGAAAAGHHGPAADFARRSSASETDPRH